MPLCGPLRSGAAPALVLLASLLRGAAAQESEPYRLPPVYISATRIPEEFSGRRMAVLDSSAIAARGAASIAELLDGLPGVHLRTRGPWGVQSDLEMGGASFSQVLVLVDGMRVNDPQTGHHNLNVPLRPADLERIEVVYGAGSSVHGPDAFGGVVNLVPRRAPARQVEVSTRFGRAHHPDRVAGVASAAALRYGWSGARGSLALNAGKERSDGYRETTEFDVDRLYVQARLPLAGGLFDLQGGVEDKAFGANDFYAPFPSKEWTRAWLWGGQYRGPLGPGRQLAARAYYRRHRDRFVLTVEDPGRYENRHLNEVVAGEAYMSVEMGQSGHLIAGFEANRERIDSNNLGEHDQGRGALFGEYSRRLGRGWGLGGGARLDYSGGYGWELSPSLNLSRTWTRTRLHANVGRAFRAPSFTEFYYQDPNNVGNAELEAERAWSWETGLEFHPRPALRAQAALFARYERNLVDYVRPAGTPPWQATNLGKVRSLGVQATVAHSGWSALRPTLSYTYYHKTRTLAPELESKYVFTHPRQQILLELDHALPAHLRGHWLVSGRERQRAGDYLLVDLALRRPFAYGQFLLRLQNLTDAEYQEVAGVPAPGRWFGVEARFDL